MWFDISKFSKEQKLLRALKPETGLPPLRQEVLKQQLLSRLAVGESVSSALSLNKAHLRRLVWLYVASPLMLLIIGTSTIFASAKSLPGEPLYAVKKLKEKVEVAVALNETAQAKVEAKHAATRLEELTIITNQVQTTAVSEPTVSPEAVAKVEKLETEVTNETHDQLEKALNSLNEVSVRLQDRGELKEASKLKEKINELTAKARENIFEVELETERSRYQVKVKERKAKSEREDDNNDKSRSESRRNEQTQESERENKNSNWPGKQTDNKENNDQPADTSLDPSLKLDWFQAPNIWDNNQVKNEDNSNDETESDNKDTRSWHDD